MKVTVVTGSWARRYVHQELTELILPEGASIGHALDLLGIPDEEAGLTVINNKASLRQTQLQEGDCIKVYPVIVGG